MQGRSALIYEEEGKTAAIEAEMLDGQFDLVIYLSRLDTWQEPYSNLRVSENNKKQIKENIASHLSSKGLIVDWA